MSTTKINEIVDGILKGDPRAIAQSISVLEDRETGHEALIEAIYPNVGTAYRIGVTGPPGSGKSTLVNKLGEVYAAEEIPTGIVAVDPSSPFTGGAVLGDRVRMGAARSPYVFIRSMATRGKQGGLAPTTLQVCDLLDASGKEILLVETVGVGQSEVEVSNLVDTTLLVLTPESGDSIQAMKAGIMEIGDLVVINKADRGGADRIEHEIRTILHMRQSSSTGSYPDDSENGGPGDPSPKEPSSVEILQVSARDGDGIQELYESIRETIDETRNKRQDGRASKIHAQINLLLQNQAFDYLENDDHLQELKTEFVNDVLAGTISPYGAAKEILEQTRF